MSFLLLRPLRVLSALGKLLPREEDEPAASSEEQDAWEETVSLLPAAGSLERWLDLNA